jgi:hypothetical protein
VHLLNPRRTYLPADSFFLDFFPVRFWAFLGKESSKTAQKFLQKVHVESFLQKINKNFHVSFSSTFLFYRVFGCFSATGVQKHHKNRCTKNRLEKCLPKNSTKNPKPIFFSVIEICFR